VIDILRRQEAERGEQWRHSKLMTYGIGSERSEPAEWQVI